MIGDGFTTDFNRASKAFASLGNAAAMAGGAFLIFHAKFQLARNKFSGNSHDRRKAKRYLKRKLAESEAFIQSVHSSASAKHSISR